jgi:hypothetical protein
VGAVFVIPRLKPLHPVDVTRLCGHVEVALKTERACYVQVRIVPGCGNHVFLEVACIDNSLIGLDTESSNALYCYRRRYRPIIILPSTAQHCSENAECSIVGSFK